MYNPNGKIIRKDYDAPKVGARFKMWSSGREDGLSTILEVRPYTGRYPEHFKYTVRFTQERKSYSFSRGWGEVAWGHPRA